MELAAQKREIGKASHLRQQGLIPAVIYNKELNLSISVEKRAFDKVFRSQGTSSIIDLKVDGSEDHAVLVKAVQMDKRRREPQHVDFYAVIQGQAVEVHVPVELKGKALGVRENGGLLDMQKREVFISILPRLIPNHVEIDITNLGMHESIHVKDLVANLPAEATILDDLEATIVTVVPPRVIAEDEEGTPSAEPEVIAKGKDEDED